MNSKFDVKIATSDVVDMSQPSAAVLGKIKVGDHRILPMPFESKNCDGEDVEELNKSQCANHAEEIEVQNPLFEIMLLLN